MIGNMLIIIWLHFIADFLLQSDKMAMNKSRDIRQLGIHCAVYALPFLLFGIEFALITCGAHFIIDFISSRLTSYYWKTKQRHWFFVTIGFDQAIHLTCLILLLELLGIT